MLIDKTIDIYSRSENVVLPKGEDFLFDISAPVFSESVHMGQFVDRPAPHNVDATSFLNHSQMMVHLMLAGLLATSLFVYLFQWIASNQRGTVRFGNRHRSSRLKPFVHQLLKLKSYYKSYLLQCHILTKTNMIVLFFLLFVQLLLNMISSNIKTNEVIVNVK